MATLPPLRQDLALHAAPPASDGSPCWHLHDPAANKFYQIGWLAFEILSRWELGEPEAIVQSIEQETTLDVSIDTVRSVANFLERHHLFSARSEDDLARLEKAYRNSRMHWAKWLLHNYLFFRVPLVRPDRWLTRWAWLVRPAMDARFWIFVAAFALTGLFLVARQWEQFIHDFSEYSGLETLLAFGIALSVAKVGHELGHAFAAKYHGCKVPTMGVAFLVLWPVLYTDTNEAWKLPSNRSRFQIAVAGMATELTIAAIATWAWLMLPDGPMRAAALFIATTSWIMTLALNASPFMRFDGYFLLVDALGLPNLHARSFALGRWWMRERLFGFDEPPPEDFPLRHRNLLILFAFATWLYRFLLFLSIALLVYHAFFKLLGILLMTIEIAWFIFRPAIQEIESWWTRRKDMRWNNSTRRTLVVAGAVLTAVLMPRHTDINVSAMLVSKQEQNMYAPQSAMVRQLQVNVGDSVKTGQTLRQRLAQQAFNDQLLEQGDVLRKRWEEAQAQLQGWEAQKQRLEIKAQFDGQVVMLHDDLHSGAWVTEREILLVLADPSNAQVQAFVHERDLDRLRVGSNARFIPEAAEHGTRSCRISDIERVNLGTLDEASLASAFGGPIPARIDRFGILTPTAPYFRVRLDQCNPKRMTEHRLRGSAHLDADGRSLFADAIRQLFAVLIRESGF